jgi:hypothetical protein
MCIADGNGDADDAIRIARNAVALADGASASAWE